MAAPRTGFSLAGTPRLLKGDLVNSSLVFWYSAKIQKTCKSSGAAESRAAADTEDEFYALRFQAVWSLDQR